MGELLSASNENKSQTEVDLTHGQTEPEKQLILFKNVATECVAVSLDAILPMRKTKETITTVYVTCRNLDLIQTLTDKRIDAVLL